MSSSCSSAAKRASSSDSVVAWADILSVPLRGGVEGMRGFVDIGGLSITQLESLMVGGLLELSCGESGG